MLLFTVAAKADGLLPLPSTTGEAATQEVELSVGQMRALISQLNSDDPQDRAQARQQLSSISIDDLSVFKTAAEAEAPLSPEQIEAIREIAAQTFLTMPSEDPVQAHIPPRGRLGIYWNPGRAQECERGVIVDERFTVESYRKLQPGDIIVSLVGRPYEGALNFIQLVSWINRMQPGETVHLSILRGGQQIDVPVVLASVPQQLNEPGAVQVWIQQRLRQFQEYWNSEWRDLGPRVVDEPRTNP